MLHSGAMTARAATRAAWPSEIAPAAPIATTGENAISETMPKLSAMPVAETQPGLAPPLMRDPAAPDADATPSAAISSARSDATAPIVATPATCGLNSVLAACLIAATPERLPSSAGASAPAAPVADRCGTRFARSLPAVKRRTGSMTLSGIACSFSNRRSTNHPIRS